jgi:cytochrome c556
MPKAIMTLRLLAASLLLFPFAYVAGGADDVPEPTLSIMELMVTIVTPATDTLWGIDDPQSDAEWQVFIDAANTVIDAGRTIKVGGTGPNDNTWAADPEWQTLADRLIGAGEDARTAAENQDVEAMYTAGEVLYPPCEECHLQFNPGVAGEQ